MLQARSTDEIVEGLEEKQGVNAAANEDAMAQLDEFKREGAGSRQEQEWLLRKVDAGDAQSSNELLAYEKRMTDGAGSAELKDFESTVMHADPKDV